MRRRRERTPREKAAAAAPEEEVKKGEQGAEEYQCSGVLEQDLAELCARAGIVTVPAVTPRVSPAGPTDGPHPCAVEGLETLGERWHGQRCVQVETEHDDPRSVREVFVRDWSIEEEMLGVLGKCLPALPHLRALHFWRAGLTDRLLPALTALLARCPGLGTLSLEGNPLPEHSFHLLLGPGSTLSHLSLRNNGIGDEAARLLGQSLSTLGSSNRSLVSLVLSFNHISDLGAGHIAQVPPPLPLSAFSVRPLPKGLRWNRSLLSLSLAHNEIGDEGALRMAEVLGPFALTHAEVVERRRLLLAEAMEKPQAVSVVSVTAPADPRPTRSRGAKAASKEQRSTEAQDAAEPSHPLLEPGWHRQGQVVVPGNRALLNLNLSRECWGGGPGGAPFPPLCPICAPPLADNRITERGLAAFLALLQGQQQEEQPGGGTGRPGLLRLSLQRNSFPPSCEAFAQLQELLQRRDPVPKAREEQAPPDPEGEPGAFFWGEKAKKKHNLKI
ncbi:leucine-rich repeat-containing protein 71 [Aythya fuligula]|uniref:Leucine-rich repeat-containing protein 71 n=1 Tax=Aythya fuligula TaxID=219594 RepID=A0A6J3EFU5_AYTFU|nr:leucine-rich repeat-containing protein 71 [Aythya fuligula]